MLGPPDLLAEMEDLASKEMGKGNLPQSDGGPSIEGKSSREGKGILFYGFVRFLRRKVLHFGERRLHIYYYIGNSFLSGPPVLQAASGSEERRVGKECDDLCRSRWSPYH
jgi:hypothetical protein